MLLEAGADPNTCDLSGTTILMRAARLGKAELVQMLVDAGAKLNIQNPAYKETALIIASSYGNTEAVEILLKAGADKNIKNWEGKTALMLATGWKYTKIVELLKK